MKIFVLSMMVSVSVFSTPPPGGNTGDPVSAGSYSINTPEMISYGNAQANTMAKIEASVSDDVWDFNGACRTVANTSVKNHFVPLLLPNEVGSNLGSLPSGVAITVPDCAVGACGTANGGSFGSAPAANLCASGTASAVVDAGATFTWTCTGTSVDACSATDTSAPTLTWNLMGYGCDNTEDAHTAGMFIDGVTECFLDGADSYEDPGACASAQICAGPGDPNAECYPKYECNGVPGPPPGCFADTDTDGFGDPASPGACGAGFVADNTDCCDSDANAFPGQTSYFTTARVGCGGFDYNCDSIVTKNTGGLPLYSIPKGSENPGIDGCYETGTPYSLDLYYGGEVITSSAACNAELYGCNARAASIPSPPHTLRVGDTDCTPPNTTGGLKLNSGECWSGDFGSPTRITCR